MFVCSPRYCGKDPTCPSVEKRSTRTISSKLNEKNRPMEDPHMAGGHHGPLVSCRHDPCPHKDDRVTKTEKYLRPMNTVQVFHYCGPLPNSPLGLASSRCNNSDRKCGFTCHRRLLPLSFWPVFQGERYWNPTLPRSCQQRKHWFAPLWFHYGPMPSFATWPCRELGWLF